MIGDIRKELDFLKLLLRNAQPAPGAERANDDLSGNKEPPTADQSTPLPNVSPEDEPVPDDMDSSVMSVDVETADSDDHLN